MKDNGVQKILEALPDWFAIILHKDESWNKMIEYRVNHTKVERRFLETTSLHI